MVDTHRYTLGGATTAVEFHPASASLATILEEKEEGGARARVLVIDAAARDAHLPREWGPQYALEVSESLKSMSSVALLLDWLLEQRVQRGALLCAIGGGVISDLAGFVASIYQRGIALCVYPTTLLAMVDASFGGKTGINYGGYKNMVGSFYPAERIVIVPSVLASLPQHELVNGLAEVIKSALLGGDEELFGILRLRRRALLDERDLVLYGEVVRRSLAVKAQLATTDFTDHGARALLNLGHTFAHALESSGDFARWSHGAAVAWGMGQALRLGVALQMTERAYAETVWQLLAEYGYALEIERLDWEQLTVCMTRDKKATGDVVRFIIPCALGRNEIVPLKVERVAQLLRSAPPVSANLL